LLEALTGRREYPGDPIEAAVARLHRSPAVPENLPYGLTGLLRTMTADEPAERTSAAHVYEMLSHDVAAVPSQIRGQIRGQIRAHAGAPPVEAGHTMPITTHRRRRRHAVWLAPAGLAIAATAGVIALRGPGWADATGPTVHRPATPTMSAPSTNPSSRASGSATATQTPSVASSAGSPTALPQQAVSVAAVSTRPAAAPAPGPGHGRGHRGGHGHGKAHNGPG